MLDSKYIVENAELVQQNCVNRGVAADVSRFVELEARRKTQQTEVEQLNRQANDVSKSIGKTKDPEEREARKAEGRRLREQKSELEKQLDEIVAELKSIRGGIPNMSHPDAPIGKDDKANLELFRGKTPPPQFDFPVADHVELGERLDLFDFEAGARVAGHGFYFLKNDAVRLELALQHYALEVLSREGFTPTATPDLAKNSVLEGTGYIPRGPETQIYSIENADLSLVATAEITLGGWLAGQTVDAQELPIKMCGISHCFRTEAGAHGKATRGLYRVHQFTKVEMFAFTLPEKS
ncbi:MAG: serine--tRNA ligase, partial [Planctomycetes bacterium]|nr:serine--tRNA ligase [Planctomycetota bacterium]